MKSVLTIVVAALLLVVECLAGDEKFFLDSPTNKGAFRLEIDNDIIWNRDSNFTNGWSIQYHTVRYESWEETVAPEFCKWIGKHVPTLGDQDSIVRFGQGIGQIMITPEDITNPDPPVGDLPYAGTLTYTLNWQSFNRQTARNFQITAGLLGEESYAGDVQEFLHSVWGWGEDPARVAHPARYRTDCESGLPTSFPSCPKGTYTNDWAGHIFFGPTAVLGNLMTSIEAGIGFRVGWNMQEGSIRFRQRRVSAFFRQLTSPNPQLHPRMVLNWSWGAVQWGFSIPSFMTEV
jgi:lipid A 3-O-deacylase